MLVVVGLIAVLVGLVLPGISMARRASATSKDLSNLRSLSQAHAAYMNVFKECFADAALPDDPAENDGIENPLEQSFVTTLQPYGNDALELRSPLDRSALWAPMDMTNVPTNAVLRRTSYGLNNYLSRRFSPVLDETPPSGVAPPSPADRLARVPDHSTTVCFVLMADDGAFATADHPHIERLVGVTANPDQLASVAGTMMAISAVDGRRPSPASESNYSYVDGHTATARFERQYESAQKNAFDPRAR
jgi:type II secretory pathway pseudopilin PulG